jgi:transcriptional antiterminator NusG
MLVVVCLAIAAAWRPAVLGSTVRPCAVTTSMPAIASFARCSRAPRAEFEIDFSVVDYEEEEEEEEEAKFLARRAADMEKARQALPTIANMTVADLKIELKNLGQKVTGNKADLLERLTRVRRKMSKGLPTSDSEVQRDTELHWYMLQTANGFEGTVERTLRQAIAVQKLGKSIDRIFVPLREGETSVRDFSVMPSYILIHMRMTRELHTFVTGMQYVVNFVGFDRGGRGYSGHMDGTRGFVWPRPVTDAEFENIVRLTKEVVEEEGKAAKQASLAPGDRVQIVSGPFKGLQGSVVEVGEEELCSVLLKVMGRETSVQVPVRHCAPVTAELGAVASRVDAADDEFGREGDDTLTDDLSTDDGDALEDDLPPEVDEWDVENGFGPGWAGSAESDALIGELTDATLAQAGVVDPSEGWPRAEEDKEWEEGDVEMTQLDLDDGRKA